jgi:hypothetical protein
VDIEMSSMIALSRAIDCAINPVAIGVPKQSVIQVLAKHKVAEPPVLLSQVMEVRL